MRSKILLLALLLSLPFMMTAQKTTILKSRMTAACYRTYSTSGPGLYIGDSDTYLYSGYKTGAVKNTGTVIANNWTYSGKYDTLNRRRYDTVSTYLHYYNRDRTYNHYVGSNNNIDTSTYQTYDTVLIAYKNYSRNIYTFDANNNTLTNLTDYWVASAWRDSTEHLYTYDGGNNMLTDTSKNLGNSNNNNVTVYHYTSGTLDTSTSYNWSGGSYALTNNSRRTVYYLNTSSKPDSTVTYGWSTGSSTWNANNKIHYIYSGGNVTIDTNKSLFGGTWYVSTDNYTYSGTNMTSDTAKANIGTGFANTSLYVMTYDGSSNETSCEKYSLVSAAWRDTALYTNTYNSYNQNTMYMTQTRLGGTSWGFSRTSNGFGGYNYDVMNLYYYSTYNDPTSVQPLGANNTNGNLKLYPVPANNMLNIDLSWNNTQSSVIAIYDMTGRLWMQWQAENTSNYKHTVYISQLPAGNYIVKVRGESDQAVQPFVIVR